MRVTTSPRECLPTGDQELLLAAALLPREAALAAWKTWRSRHDAADADPGSLRMFPQIHLNLSLGAAGGAGMEGDLDVLRRAHRGAWSRNQRLIAAARPVLASMQEAGLAPVLLKGSSLALTVYGDAGARPMVDVDLLVRPQQALEAGAILASHGFVPQFRFDEQRVRTLNGVGFVHAATDRPAFGAIDLHWHLLPEPCDEAFDEAVHANAKPATLAGLPVLVLDATDELLLACAHGIRWNPTPPFRWAADVHLLVTRAGTAIDWSRFVETTLRHGFSLPVLTAFRYAIGTLATPVPAAVVADLERVTPGLRERLEFLVRVSPGVEGTFGNVPDYLLRWMRQTRGASFGARLGGLPRYLADCWGCREVSDVPRHAFFLARRRLARPGRA